MICRDTCVAMRDANNCGGQWMGATHFLTKTLPKVRTEMSLHVLAYNIKRMIALFGTATLIEAMRA